MGKCLFMTIVNAPEKFNYMELTAIDYYMNEHQKSAYTSRTIKVKSVKITQFELKSYSYQEVQAGVATLQEALDSIWNYRSKIGKGKL